MKDILLIAAGSLGMLTSVVHGYIGETKVVRPVQAASGAAKRVLHGVMFLSAIYWFVASLALIATPTYFNGEPRAVIAYLVAAIFASGAAVNFWATRGRHFGWALLLIACLLAVAGA